ncbi:MAG TPA: hypothetical protein VLT33_21915, partial [Labilithrix sp.]|nr:hypothetical protein [Labilithrix sp.]
QVSANDRVTQAQAGQARRARALTHPPSRAALAPSASYVLKQSFDVTQGPFAGLSGEVAVARREWMPRRSSKARIFVDDRLLEEVQLPGVELPLEMALSWPSVLVARLAYDGVERTAAVTRAVLYALRVAALAVGEQLGPRDPELARLAIVASAGAARDLGDPAPAASTLGPLANAPVWPTTDGGSTSLAAFDAYALRTGALCTAAAGAGPAADGRPVIVTAHARTLLKLLRETTVLVDYERVLARGEGSVTTALADEGSKVPVRVPIARGDLRGFVGIGPSRRRILHGGEALRDEAFAFRNGPVTVVIEDRAAVPRPDYQELLWTSLGADGCAREQDALLERVVDGCESGELELPGYLDYLTAAQRQVGGRLASVSKGARREEMAALHARLVGLPDRIARAELARAKEAVLARPLHRSRLEGNAPAVSAYDVPASGRAAAASARIASPSGTVIVTLPRNGATMSPSPGEVLFEGHPVGATAACFPLAVVVDVARESLLAGFAALTAEGEAWAHEAAVLATLKLLEQHARHESFTEDLDLLRLCESLMEDQVQTAARIALVLRLARWPTVQGETTTIGSSASLHVGTVTYAPYRAAEGKPSPYDAPALCLPEGALGDARRRLLQGIGYALVDVSAEIARLQARRARGVDLPPPRLPGQALHPALRASLAELGATLVEGELEIHEEPTVAIARVDESGAAAPFSLPLAQPVRVVFRAGVVARDALAAEIAAATARHLRSLAPSLDRLPAFVRGRLRALVCESVRSGERAARDDDASVFEDIRGYTWSLARLREVGARRRTSDPPPWPAHLDGHEAAALLHLSDAEAAALAPRLQLEDVTQELRDRRLGEVRRAGPPAGAMLLPEDIRAKCIFAFPLPEEDGMRGELGLLRPAHASARAIAVHTGMRHVRTIEDREGWPTVAMVDVDALETSRRFDALAKRSDVARIQRRVRLAASIRAAVKLEASPLALGVVRLPVPFLARPRAAHAGGEASRPIPCLGVFWLEKTWPDAPTVHLEWQDGVDPFRVPRVPTAAGAHHGVLPITGRLFVSASSAQLEDALAAVFRTVLDRLSPILAATSGAKRAPPEELAAYAWDLRLLGARTDEDPVAELAKDRPDAALMRVAARRAPHLIDRATGDLPPAPAPSPAILEPATVASAPSIPPAAEAPDFFTGLIRRITSLVSPAPLQDFPETPLTRALTGSLLARKLTGEPVAWVVETKSGRPVRYDAKRKTISVNVEHETVRALEPHPARIALLLVAAVSEINRELVPVTDAEEMAVLVDLLREGA